MDILEHNSLSAREAGLKSCTSCGTLLEMHEQVPCRRCGATVFSRRRESLQRVLAFLLVGILAYIPANTFPILLTQSFSGDTSDTILSGVFELINTGSVFVAVIIFIASIMIPIGKFVVIALLVASLYFEWDMSEHTRHRLHKFTEFIGRWSMIDVFVVAVLAALIQLEAILTILPGAGINAFALSVIFTMLSANALDPRLFWDTEKHVN